MKRMIFKLPYLRFGRAVLVLTALAGLMSCGTSFSDTTKDSETECLKLMNWNLQTFFDSNFDGNEYTEFKNKKSGWSQEKYEIRLDRLASVVKKMDADVVIMEEIEKEEQIQDISARVIQGVKDLSTVGIARAMNTLNTKKKPAETPES